MRTSVDIPDDLYRLSKAEAALHRLTLRFLIEEGLRLVLLVRSSANLPADLSKLIHQECGPLDLQASAIAANLQHPEHPIRQRHR